MRFVLRDYKGAETDPGRLPRLRALRVPHRPRGPRRRPDARTAVFVAKRDTLVTKCPSKYPERPSSEGADAGVAPVAMELLGRGALPSPCCSPSTPSSPACSPGARRDRRSSRARGTRRRRRARRRARRRRRVPDRDRPARLPLRDRRRARLARAAARPTCSRPSGSPGRARCCSGCRPDRGSRRSSCGTNRRAQRRADAVAHGDPRRHGAFFALLVVVARARSRPSSRPPTATGSTRRCRTRTWSPTRRCSTSATSASRSRSRSHGGAARRPRGRALDRRPRAAGRWRPGASSASACCSAPTGPTRRSAGAATGPGIRSRTPR